ncbi:adenosine deaminase [Lactobacillus helveticus]|uniref:Adenine deaminase n=1 Tax=Lactobacillus delbrueckii subsp. bulgaricus TaxID=1585 RepID=A0AAV5PCQ7_LACDE|nr:MULTISPECIES: adenosine deaminase [Lactobacillus]ADY85084.1 Adenosine deaminase [Lactobacillus delbrueckii subsp. bulgaricus 2038]ANZ55240.1 adenosine deaminase [Lactobacillus helveticus]AQY53346.1 adenosine deaminase [Lactobacillus helveticus]AXI15022.1 Adenosine deaminase [Lactobacillus delbrueckii subsp. bulgaricus]KIY24548.1 adenine deaminase [Lactobacillus delbrueckii subsp. bulgaricus]
MSVNVTREFINGLPKAELHVHIEGTLEPDLKLKLAQKNQIDIGQKTIEEVRASYQFDDLASFLAVYYPAMNVLQTEDDFYELAMAYLRRASENNVRHAEIFFDPQAHTSRGISFATVINGLYRATVDARALNVDARLIMCFLRDYSRDSARKTLLESSAFRDKFIGVGLDSDEHNNPPMKFFNQFTQASADGLHVTAHADIDQKDSIEHIRELLEVIGSERIDHGTNVVEDPDLVEFAAKNKIGFTSCPLSNSFVSPEMKGKEVLELLDNGVKVSIHSDDPAYFGGYISDNYYALAKNFNLSQEQVVTLAKNSFETSWISKEQKALYLKEIDDYVNQFNA